MPVTQLVQRGAQHQRTDVADQPHLLGHREELLGAQQAAFGVAPSGQHFEAGEAATAELDDRLVVGDDLAPVETLAQLIGGAQGEEVGD